MVRGRPGLPTTGGAHPQSRGVQIYQEAGKVVWYSHFLKNFPQFIVIHTVKGFGISNETLLLLLLLLSRFSRVPLCATP